MICWVALKLEENRSQEKGGMGDEQKKKMSKRSRGPKRRRRGSQ